MTSVLFVRLSAMGDLVHGLGAVQALARSRPDWRLSLVTQDTYAPLLLGMHGLLRVVPFGRRDGWRGVWRLRAALRQDRYDVALDLQGNWKSAFVARLGGARSCIGAGPAWRQEPCSRVLLHRTVAVPGERHPALVAWSLVRSLASEVPFAPPRLEASEAEVADEAAAVRALGIDASRPFRVVVVTDPADPRALRPDAIAAESRTSTVPVLHLLGPAEAGLAAAAGTATLRHGPGELRRLVALGALVARAGGCVVGPDQGASHVLAAAGADCRILYGAQDPRRTAPLNATAMVHPHPPDCSPCSRRRCNRAEGPICMDFTSREGRVVPTGLPTAARLR